MNDLTIRPAFSKWPDYNRRLRDVVAAMTDEQLGMRPAPERWPLWATVGHAACQRVFWLCDFSHDVYHAAELNETLGNDGLPLSISGAETRQDGRVARRRVAASTAAK